MLFSEYMYLCTQSANVILLPARSHTLALGTISLSPVSISLSLLLSLSYERRFLARAFLHAIYTIYHKNDSSHDGRQWFR